MRYRFLYGKRTLKTRRPYAGRTSRTRYQHAEGSSWNWHILCPPTSAYCGRSVGVRLPCRGRAERSHSVCIACSLRTGRTSAYAENFCACIKFLGVRNELRRTSAYDTVLWTLAQPPPDVLPTCISVWQRMTKSRHTQAYAELIRWYVTATLDLNIKVVDDDIYTSVYDIWRRRLWISYCKFQLVE